MAPFIVIYPPASVRTVELAIANIVESKVKSSMLLYFMS